MKNFKLLLLVFLCAMVVFPLAAYTKQSSYQTFVRQQFKIKVLKNWHKKLTSESVNFYPKKTKKVSLEAKKITLKSKEQNYLKKKKVSPFAKIYKKKIQKEYKKLNPKFQKASKFKISDYKVIKLNFLIIGGELNAYYITDNNLYHRVISVCQKNCSLYDKQTLKIIKSFRTVADTTPPIFSGATSAASISTSSMTISWSAAADDVSLSSKIKYLIYQANQLEEQNFTSPTYTTIAGATSCTLSGLEESTSYYFVVRAADESGNIDTNTQEVIATTKAAANDDPATAGSPQLVTYKSNGFDVQGLMYRPAGSGPFPAIIYNHGSVTPYDPSWSLARVQSLNESGKYVVLATAYRGDIGSEGTLSINLGDVNDILAGIEYLKSKSYVDANRLGMFGESRGGASTLLAAERTSELKAVVSWYPYTNTLSYCQYLGTTACLELFWGLSFNSASLGFLDLPTNYQHILHITSAVNHADKLTMPLQNSHGTADPLVPYSQSEELNAAMAGKTNYTFYSYEGADHGGSAVWSGEATVGRQEFFENNL